MMEVDMLFGDDTLFMGVDGVLAHLDDSDEDVVDTTLESLLELLSDNWAQIADSLPVIEDLSERGARYSQKASLLASMVFFHLQSYEFALQHALAAGDLFRIDDGSDFAQKLTEQCIDSYRKWAQERYAFDRGVSEQEPEAIADDRLVEIVERMLDQCYLVGDFKHAVGIAIECRRLDHVEKAIDISSDKSDLLDHIFYLCESVISSRIFRDEVLTLIVRIYEDLSIPNFTNICRSYFYLAKPIEISRILWSLAKEGSERSLLLAFQVAFDLSEYKNERFQSAIYSYLPKPPVKETPPPTEAAATEPSETSAVAVESEAQSAAEATDKAAEEPATADTTTAVTSTVGASESGSLASASLPRELVMYAEQWTPELLDTSDKLKSILLGEKVIPLELDFLFRKSSVDMIILKTIKENISERDSVLNGALVMCNALMNCGTTIDQFLRDNLDWFSQAAHWSKFSGVASLGVVHFHHLNASRTILERYLPGASAGGSPYQEGGALYALGLIHCGDSSQQTSNEVRSYILQQLSQASNEILQHGACLGLGLAALGSQEPVFLSQVKEILYHDRAVPGEAAGITLGLLLTGGAAEAAAIASAAVGDDMDDVKDDSIQAQWFDEMLSYAHETQHEKIVRGLVMGIALMYYDFGERADAVVNTLIKDDSAVIRYGGCFTIGMAYACTGNNKALAQLLHLAVSDVSDDVRRAAVLCIGFVLANKPSAVPRVVQLLANSYNSHVRYGAAAAIGIACAATGNSHAVALLKKMYAEDHVDYVKQAALLSLAMILQQQNEKESPAVKEVRDDLYLKAIKAKRKRKHDMNVMGAIYGLGIMNGAGRNAVLSLCAANGSQKRMTAIIGMALFWQHWYWHPLVPFLSLAFKPTFAMALNKDLKMPAIEFRSGAPPSTYGYPTPLKEEDLKTKVKTEVAVLSITAKSKARTLKKQKQKEEAAAASGATSPKPEESEDVEMKDAAETVEKDASAEDATDKGETEKGDEAKDKDKENESKPEAKFQMLANPSRVTPNQQRVVKWTDSRFRPVRGLANGGKPICGVILVEDSKPSDEVQFVEEIALDTGGVHGNEPKPPAPFKYLGD